MVQEIHDTRMQLRPSKCSRVNFRYNCNELGDLGVGWSPTRPTTAIRFPKEHRHNPVMV